MSSLKNAKILASQNSKNAVCRKLRMLSLKSAKMFSQKRNKTLNSSSLKKAQIFGSQNSKSPVCRKPRMVLKNAKIIASQIARKREIFSRKNARKQKNVVSQKRENVVSQKRKNALKTQFEHIGNAS